MFGKWHLGANYPYRPMDRGFDEWLGLGDGGPGTSDDYFWNDRVNDTYWHNGEREYRNGYNPDVFYGAAIEHLRNYDSENPFFIYLPTYAPHKPCTLPDRSLADRYLEAGVPIERALFYAMIERVDQNIGKLRATLDEQGFAENTILIFMSDNGSTHGRTSFNAGMSGGKGSNLDGGHRVPCYIHWPAGGLGEGKNVSTLTAHIDLLPTLTELCDMTLPKAIDFDGSSLVPLLRGKQVDWPERTLYVESQRAAEYEWHLEIAKAGIYEFEVRRWPKEVIGGLMTGVPPVTKTVDAWDKGPKTHLLYGNTFKALPIEKVSLRVGDFAETRHVMASDESVVFEVKLPKGKVSVDAAFYDQDGTLMTKAYYVYVRKK